MNHATGGGEPLPPVAPGAPGGAARTHRDPGGRLGGLVAWLVIVASVVVVLVALRGAKEAPDGKHAPAEAALADPGPAGGIVELQGRYALGARELSPEAGVQVHAQLETVLKAPADRLRLAMLAGELKGGEAALERLEKIENDVHAAREKAGSGAEAEGAGWFESDVAALRELYTTGAGALTAEQRTALQERHGWFTRVALVYGAKDGDPERAALLAQASRFITIVLGGVVVIGVGVLVGVGLLIAGIVGASSGWLRTRYHPPAPGGSVYLEAFALFLAGFLAVQAVSAVVHSSTGIDASRWLIWLLPLCALWPVARGATWAEWRHATGWHAGRGIVRELGAGLVGYVAGLPIFALGVVITAALVMIGGGEGGQQPSHPIIDEVGKGGAAAALGLYLLASVWAPMTEETMFRGCFYHHLRGRAGIIGSSLVTAFIFAVIHPQGWMAVPALMGLAVPFALIREWRGSIVGPMVAHALHNGTLVTVLTLVMRR